MSRRKPNTRERDKKAAERREEQVRTTAAKATFLEQFVASGTITAACRASSVGRTTHYDWLASDPEYAERFKQAEVQAIDVLESEARRRALVGVDEPVYYKGEVVGKVRKYSDTLLMFMLNGRRSDVFRQRHEHTGKDGGPIHTVTLPIESLTEEELAMVRRILEKAEPKPEAVH